MSGQSSMCRTGGDADNSTTNTPCQSRRWPNEFRGLSIAIKYRSLFPYPPSRPSRLFPIPNWTEESGTNEVVQSAASRLPRTSRVCQLLSLVGVVHDISDTEEWQTRHSTFTGGPEEVKERG